MTAAAVANKNVPSGIHYLKDLSRHLVLEKGLVKVSFSGSISLKNKILFAIFRRGIGGEASILHEDTFAQV